MIDDGYTAEGRITDGDDTIFIRYRPMLSAERRSFLQAYRGWPREVAIAEKCRWLQRHVVDLHPFSTVADITWLPKLFTKLHHILCGLKPTDDAKGWSPYWEVLDARNLKTGIRITVLHPQLDRRSCKDCKKWWFNEDTGAIEKVDGVDSERPAEFPVMCDTRDGCPVGTPDNQLRLTQKNRMAYLHFLRCEAINSWPDDPIVARNAAVIRRARDESRRERSSGYGPARGRSGGDLAGSRGNDSSVFIPANANPFFSVDGSVPV